MVSHLVRCSNLLVIAAIMTPLFSATLLGQFGAQPAGIEIDANGVLRISLKADPNGILQRKQIEAAKANLNREVQVTSAHRMVSLNRLEAVLRNRLDSGQSLDPEMLYLAGLTSITNVYFYPETNDIVIAGPAEGFYQDPNGRILGIESHKAVLRLEDLIVALRCFAPGGDKTSVIGCSIDPTQEGLKKFNEVKIAAVKNIKQPYPGLERELATAYANAIGKHVVSVKGVSPKTHFAQVLVEADYRMKLIGIGLEVPAVTIKSWAERANPRAAGAMQRWYFTPNYEGVIVSEDENAMQLVGDGVKLIGEQEKVTADGGRVSAGQKNLASEGFTKEFTKKYPQLAEKTPVFAELKNLVDMSIVAAFIQEMDYYGKADWNLGIFGDEQKLSVETYAAPKMVDAAVNVFWKGSALMSPIGGGVNIQARKAIASDNMKQESDGKIAKQRLDSAKVNLAENQWWWD
jgi:hypothetical protein